MIMNRLYIALIIAVALTNVGQAQMQVSSAHVASLSVAGVSDPTMIVRDRGTDLEILAGVRAVKLQATTSGAALQKTLGVLGSKTIVQSNPDRAFAIPTEFGVVFNHTLNLHGVTTGEITFQLKPGVTAQSFGKQNYPGFRKLTNPNVFIVVTNTPAEFVKTFKAIQARSGVSWVEPNVTYGSLQAVNTTR
jgi:hypothetical protein